MTTNSNFVETSALDLDDVHETLIEIAYKAGDIITGALPATNAAGSKKNSKSLRFCTLMI